MGKNMSKLEMTTEAPKSRGEILSEALKAREEEILHYQINIDNYRLAIQKSKDDEDLAAFCDQLRDLLASSLLEQKKAKIMLEVIKDQIED
jgi:hypothetical protein